MAAILEREPDWNALPASTTPADSGLLRRCLEKDRARRLADIADVGLEIDDAFSAAIFMHLLPHPPRGRMNGSLGYPAWWLSR